MWARKYIPEVYCQCLIQNQHRTNTCEIFRRTTISLKLLSRSENIGVLYLKASRLAWLITRRSSPCCCTNTAPKPAGLASAITLVGVFLSKYPSVSALDSRFFNS